MKFNSFIYIHFLLTRNRGRKKKKRERVRERKLIMRQGNSINQGENEEESLILPPTGYRTEGRESL